MPSRNTSRGNGTSSLCKRQSRRILDESFFYVKHYAGCAVLFNKDSFHSDIKVTSVYLHDTRNWQQQVMKEVQSGWVLEAVISRALFRRLPRNGKSFFTVMSLHINNHYAKKRGIGKKLLLAVRTVMLQQHVDMVAGDFNGAAWRRPSGSDPRPSALLKNYLSTRAYPCHPAPHCYGGQEACQVNGLTCAGSWNHRVLKQNGKFVCKEPSPSRTARWG